MTHADLEDVKIMFHDSLGHLTTIRTAIWEMDQKVENKSPEFEEARRLADKEAGVLCQALIELKEKIYSMIEETTSQENS